jgi:antitoxin CptB
MAADDPDLRRLEWRCRRGMKELDLLLLRHLRQLPVAGSADRALFAEFLDLPDPSLARYLIAGDHPDDERFAALCRAIRAG